MINFTIYANVVIAANTCGSEKYHGSVGWELSTIIMWMQWGVARKSGQLSC